MQTRAAAGICAVAGSVPADVIVSCAFGSPYEGDIAPESVAALGRRLAGQGAARVTYADTTGMATPARIDALVDLTGDDVGLHLHDTRGTALVNAYAALLRGVRRFDTHRSRHATTCHPGAVAGADTGSLGVVWNGHRRHRSNARFRCASRDRRGIQQRTIGGC